MKIQLVASPRKPLLSRALSYLGLLALVSTSGAAVVINPNIHYIYADGPGEGLSVSSDGRFIMISSPIPQDPAATIFSSFVPQFVHTPLAPEPFHPTHNL